MLPKYWSFCVTLYQSYRDHLYVNFTDKNEGILKCMHDCVPVHNCRISYKDSPLPLHNEFSNLGVGVEVLEYKYIEFDWSGN